MLISEMIEALEKAKEKFGDKPLVMWLDTGDDTQYPVEVKKCNLKKITKSEVEDNGLNKSTLGSVYINLGKYNERKDSLYDY